MGTSRDADITDSVCLYTAGEVRELDRIAIEDHGIPGLTLMRRAADACVQEISDRYGGAGNVSGHQVVVFCGSGNNAGDGYILAGLLAQARRTVTVITVGDVSKLGDDARAGYDFCRASGAGLVADEADVESKGLVDLVVDALLGIGLAGDVRDRYRRAIAAIDQFRAAGAGVLAVDTPSGLCADTGRILGAAVKADVTISFIGRKRGLYTLDGPDCAGEIVFADLDVPAAVYTARAPSVRRLADDALLVRHHRPRPLNSHKGTFGRLLLIGGDTGMPGAIAMAAETALMSGAGLVNVATRPDHMLPIISRCPEVMVHGIEQAGEIRELLDAATAVVIGPGLGRGEWGVSLLRAALERGLPMVLDADALNLLADLSATGAPGPDDRIYTPHPGEAATLLGVSAQTDRFAAVATLQQRLGGVVVLKGVGSLIAGEGAGEGEISLCPYGNPGMAVAGMGDVLSGVLGALLAAGYSPMAAAQTGVVVHARAGDAVARRVGESGLRATELMPEIRRLLNRGHRDDRR